MMADITRLKNIVISRIYLLLEFTVYYRPILIRQADVILNKTSECNQFYSFNIRIQQVM